MQNIRTFFVLLLFSMFAAACGPAVASPVVTSPSATVVPSASASATVTPSQVPTNTETMVPTESPTLTITPVPTFDLASSRIIAFGRKGEVQTFFTMELPAILGEYYAEVDGEVYECVSVDGYDNRLYCVGKVIAYHTPLVVELHQENSGAVVLVLESKGYAPPQQGDPNLTCEVEPLWGAPHFKSVGCYAATCYYRSDGSYAGGTEDSCEDPFPYWLYMTPSP